MGGAHEVLGVDLRVVRIEDRRFDGALEELVRVPAEELVERVLPGDVDGEPAPAPAGPPPHLPEARDRARERDADRGVELADVDPELERIGRDDAEQLSGGEPPLDVLTLGGRVAGAIRRDPLGELGVEPVARVLRISSIPLRDFMKQIVRAPARISSENTSAAS